MIEIKNLEKSYGTYKAVDGISLTMEKGKIYGLLGSNGAGKSTTMNIMTGFIGASSGTVTIDGFDILHDAAKAKKNIGYLPEIPPLYPEMTVEEYLKFVAELKGVSKSTRKDEIEKVMTMADLHEVRNKLIRKLSKGYKQRVGFAQAVMGSPEVIILDEPTVAVDPQSRNNILDGIKKLRDEGATILYTTHYMEEVEMICDRIIILDKGKILAEGTSDELKKLANIEEKITVEVDEISNDNIETIKKFKTVDAVSLNRNILMITYKKGKDNLGELTDYLKENKIKYNKIFSERPTLNDVFLELTGKELRD